MYSKDFKEEILKEYEINKIPSIQLAKNTT